jgi:hypothetical protein
MIRSGTSAQMTTRAAIRMNSGDWVTDVLQAVSGVSEGIWGLLFSGVSESILGLAAGVSIGV